MWSNLLWLAGNDVVDVVVEPFASKLAEIETLGSEIHTSGGHTLPRARQNFLSWIGDKGA